MYRKIWTMQEFKAYGKSTTECLQNQSMCHSSSNIITMTYKMIMTWVIILFPKTRNLVLVHSAWICSADRWIRTLLDPRCKMKSKDKSILLLNILRLQYLGSDRTDQRWPKATHGYTYPLHLLFFRTQSSYTYSYDHYKVTVKLNT